MFPSSISIKGGDSEVGYKNIKYTFQGDIKKDFSVYRKIFLKIFNLFFVYLSHIGEEWALLFFWQEQLAGVLKRASISRTHSGYVYLLYFFYLKNQSFL